MLTMNRATLVGHAGRNPEMRTLPSGDEVALFSLATTERFRRRDGTDGESTEWHAIVAFGSAARTVRKLVRRGAAVLVEGRIATRTWTDRRGTEHRTSEILVSGPQARVNVLTKRKREPNDGGDRPSGTSCAGTAKAADANRNEETADAVAAPTSNRTADTGTGEDAGSGGADTIERDEADSGAHENTGHGGGDADTSLPPEDATPAEAASAGTEGEATAAADTDGRAEPSEEDSAAGGTSDGDAPRGGTGDAESADAGDALATGVDGRSGDAGHE